jgi:phosphate transport system substrate-binding protein
MRKGTLAVAFFTLFSLWALAAVAFAETIKIDGSTTVLPISQKVAEAYMKEFSGANVSVSGGGSGNGIKALIDGATDIATSSRFLKPEEIKRAVEKGIYPVPFAVGYDCIVPVVHPGNLVSDLNINQLKAIYMGEIKNWKDVGGPDLQIVVVSRDTSSGTYEVWEEKVMKKDRIYAGALLQASNGAVLQTVSKNKYAIGYLGIGYLDKSVKPLTINGIPGNEETALSGKFPVARALFMFTRGWPAGSTLSFINFTLNPDKGQKYIQDAGFVPLY